MYVYANYFTSSEDDYADSNDDTFLISTVLTLGIVDQFLEVNKVYKDHTIEWVHMKTMENFTLYSKS